MISATPSVNFQMVLLFYMSCRGGQISFYAPDRARKKMGAQNQSALLIETQLEKLLFDLYYLKERNCLRDKFSRILANFYKSTGSKFVKLNPRIFVAVAVVVFCCCCCCCCCCCFCLPEVANFTLTFLH